MQKFSLNSSQYFYFQQKGWILFDELISEKLQQELLKDASIHSTRNLWMKKESFQKMAFSKNLASLAAGLQNTSMLRLGFDHLFVDAKDFSKVFHKETPIANTCSIQSLVCSVLINLSSNPLSFLGYVRFYKYVDEEEEPELVIREIEMEIPARGALFFQPEKLFFSFEVKDFPNLYLICYASKNARYTYCEKDPYTHDLKRLGYAFGDLLKDQYHPLFSCKTSL